MTVDITCTFYHHLKPKSHLSSSIFSRQLQSLLTQITLLAPPVLVSQVKDHWSSCISFVLCIQFSSFPMTHICSFPPIHFPHFCLGLACPGLKVFNDLLPAPRPSTKPKYTRYKIHCPLLDDASKYSPYAQLCP